MTTSRSVRWRSWRAVGVLAVVAVASVGCGGSDSGGSDGESSEPEVVSAVLEIITTNIQSSVGDAPFETATAGQELVVGDRVKTDDTGFAELAYHDGSWQRVENDATLTIEDLVDSGDGQAVSTSVDIGRTWNRVRELTEPEDAYELETPVATATVRGTAFSTDCPTVDECTFRVVEGTVEVTPLDSEPISLDAPAVLTVRRNQPPEAPQVVAPDTLRADPWIKKNLELDGERFGDDEQGAGSDAEATPGQVATASIVGSYDGVRTGVSTNLLPGAENYVAAGSTLQRSYEITQDCSTGPCVINFSVDGGAPSAIVFDGSAYVTTDGGPLDCSDTETGELLVPGAVAQTGVRRVMPTAAALVNGQWVVTAIEIEAQITAEVVKPEEFATANCTWDDTSDGQPYAQRTTSSLTRRG